jgi:hypothetical protein
LINAFACLKFTEHVNDPSKPRVLFIPDLGSFADHAYLFLLNALVMAFLDSPCDLQTLTTLSTFEGLCNFTTTKAMILIADNHNAIDVMAVKRKDTEKVRYFVAAFNNTNLNHVVVYCASANQESVKLATGKQDATRKMFIFGGCTEEELKTLMIHKFPNIKICQDAFDEAKSNQHLEQKSSATDQDQDACEETGRKVVNWQTVMSITGGVAMDAANLLEVYSRDLSEDFHFEDHAADWVVKLAKRIGAHVKKTVIIPTEMTKNRKQNVFNVLRAAAVNEPLGMDAASEDVDCSYFYPDVDVVKGQLDWSTLHPISDVVRRVALELWVKEQEEQDTTGEN